MSSPIGRAVLVIVASALLAVACGGEDEPELTFEDRLIELEGRPLTPAEVAERAEVGETLCLLDDRILDEMWLQLSEEQLDFQDVVIASLCPERAVLYAGHTGRRVTPEAEESNVRTSTTRPTSTTPTTTGPAATGPGQPATTTATTGGADQSSTGSTDGSAPTSTTATTATTPTTSTTTTTTVTSTSG